MIKSTASAGPVELHAPSSAYYLWDFPEKPVSVRLSLDVVDGVERDVLESFRAITARGSEVGGLLLGRAETGSGMQIIVENYELFRCDYTRGPLYLLSDEEKSRLDESIRRKKAMPGQAGSVVGFFRSNTRKQLVLDDEDLDLFRKYFSRPEQVVLLVKPFAAKPAAAGFFIWENGKVRGEGSYIEFPFRRSELTKGEWAKSIVIDAPKPAQAPDEPPPLAMAAKAGTRAPVLPFSKRDEEPPVPAPPLRREERPALFKMTPKPEEHLASPPPFERKLEPPAARKPLDKPVEKSVEKTVPPLAPLREEKSREDRKEDKKREVESARRAVPPPEKTEKKAPAAEPVIKVDSLPHRSAAGGKKLWALFGGLAMLALAGASLYYLKMHPASSNIGSRDSATLQLKAERSGAQMLVTWNRDSALVKTAQRAVLSISDGPQKEDVQLDATQLRGGVITYSPVTNDVSFRLEVTDSASGKTRSEYVRVPLATPDQTGAQPAAAQPAIPADGTTSAVPSPQPLQPKTTEASRIVNEPPVAGDSSPQALQVQQTQAPKPFSLAARVRTPEPAPADLPEAPAVGGSGVVVSPVAAGRIPAPVVVPPAAIPAPPLAPRPSAQPPVQTQAQPLATPGQPSRIGGKVQPPVLLRKVEPTYPAMARQARVGGVVRMQATIGKDGKIKKLDVISGPPLLKQAAIDAVNKWVYSPSLLNGAPIESTTDIDLNFSLNSR
jgi:periplasmic protein TonB